MTDTRSLLAFNRGEAVLWFVMAAIVGWWQIRRKASRHGIVLALNFMAFGFSDLFEREGWWTPWWLLAWKAACVVVFAAIYCTWRVKSR